MDVFELKRSEIIAPGMEMEKRGRERVTLARKILEDTISAVILVV